ncbi:ABC transporter permease [Candidatus Villigracilis saccharophilus]|uniref:ABC transporter permease n=1 Tax=Candidatus Villigracilis saccharophilus TaxID=3140684 RepID=UPI00313480ED|nr:ABC transporter permease [Anaerolineales bacterium]
MKLTWGGTIAALFVILPAAATRRRDRNNNGHVHQDRGSGQRIKHHDGYGHAPAGGCWYPLELFPAVVQNIVKILPTTWAMQGLLDLVIRN